MHIAYNEYPYQLDCNFNDNKKIKALVIGNSYVRDWVNILRECSIRDTLDISYINLPDYEDITKIQRLKDAVRIFICMGPAIEQGHVYDFLEFTEKNNIPKSSIYVVGSKIFGVSCGQIYSRKSREDYYQYCSHIDHGYILANEQFKEEFNNFIDLFEPIVVGNDSVRVFTDNRKKLFMIANT